MVCAVSSDGLTWQVLGDRPCVGREVRGLGPIPFRRLLLCHRSAGLPRGHGLPTARDAGRVMMCLSFAGLDPLVPAKSLAFARPGQTTVPPVPGQQTHMGAGVWNRGNVLVGLYGMWQDGPAQRPKGSVPSLRRAHRLGADPEQRRPPFPRASAELQGHRPRRHGGQWDSICLLQGTRLRQRGRSHLSFGTATGIVRATFAPRRSGWPCSAATASDTSPGATGIRGQLHHLSHLCQNLPAAACGSTSKAHVQRNAPSDGTARPPRSADAGYSGADAAKIVTSGTRQAVIWPKTVRQPWSGRRPICRPRRFPARRRPGLCLIRRPMIAAVGRLQFRG